MKIKKSNSLLVILALLISMLLQVMPVFAYESASPPAITTACITKEAESGVMSDFQNPAQKCNVREVVSVSGIGDRLSQAYRDFLRKVAVSYMKQMATVKWSPKKSFTHWSGGRTWKAGTTYRGIPYTQKNRNNNYDSFTKHLKNGKYTGPTGQTTYVGTDCSSSISAAYSFIFPKFETGNARYTGSLLPGNKYIVKVGSYRYVAGTSNTVNKNGKDKMFKAYSCLKPGDIVITTKGDPHVMMITSVGTKKVKVVHQTLYNNDLKSTWRVDEEKTFNWLFKYGYIPATLSIF